MSNYVLVNKESNTNLNPELEQTKKELILLSKKVGLSILSGCLKVVASNLMCAGKEIDDIMLDKNV